jgi:hypothetical protein
MEAIGFEKRRVFLVLHFAMWLLVAWTWLRNGVLKILGVKNAPIRTLFFDALGDKCREVKAHARSSRAIDLICDHEFKWWPLTLSRLVDNIWFSSPNCQALCNRRKLVVYEVLRAIREIRAMINSRDGVAAHGDEIKILSLAAGSAKAVLAAVASAVKEYDVRIRCHLVDRSGEALNEALAEASRLGIQDLVTVERANLFRATNVQRILRKFQPHVVEMIGLLDYMPDHLVVEVSQLIHDALPEQGRYLTATIMPCPTKAFITEVVAWPMIYRTSEQLEGLMLESGFGEVRMVSEPWKIYAVATCVQTASSQTRARSVPRRESVPARMRIAGVL